MKRSLPAVTSLLLPLLMLRDSSVNWALSDRLAWACSMRMLHCQEDGERCSIYAAALFDCRMTQVTDRQQQK